MVKIPGFTVVLLLISTFAIAERNIVLAQKPATAAEAYKPVSIASDKNFYAGLGYAYIKMNDNTSKNAITLLAGYNFYKYIAAEGRYFATHDSLNEDDKTRLIDKDWDTANVVIYLKPKYSIDKFALYGLFGYGQISLNNHTEYTENGFQWGLGANFTTTNKVEIFIDYARLYDGNVFDDLAIQDDIQVDSVNLGVAYNF